MAIDNSTRPINELKSLIIANLISSNYAHRAKSFPEVYLFVYFVAYFIPALFYK